MSCRNNEKQPYQFIGTTNRTTLQPEINQINADINMLYSNVDVLNDERNLLFNKYETIQTLAIDTSNN